MSEADTSKISSVNEFVAAAESAEIALWRGQGKGYPILPSAFRDHNIVEAQHIQRAITALIENSTLIPQANRNVWDWLMFAQHYGIKTHLVDWTTNPLVALWFACQSQPGEDGVVFALMRDQFEIIDPEKEQQLLVSEPKIRLLRSRPTNERVIAQSAWFSVHPNYTEQAAYVSLNKKVLNKEYLLHKHVAAEAKPEILKTLHKLGVNRYTIFKDTESLCRHIDWEKRTFHPE